MLSISSILRCVLTIGDKVQAAELGYKNHDLELTGIKKVDQGKRIPKILDLTWDFSLFLITILKIVRIYLYCFYFFLYLHQKEKQKMKKCAGQWRKG